jgi:alpha/beta superfamily hydrolase
MSETKIVWGELPGGPIEALLDEAPGGRAALVSHPHPLYGGDMYNHVVAAIAVAYRAAGVTTLRFNFRGIGQREDYDQAEGGKADVSAALAYLQGIGKSEIDLAGYSFGAWINAIGLEGFDSVSRLILVSPPVGLMDFSALKPNDRLKLVITGAQDSMAPAAELNTLVPRWNPRARLEVIAGADHFYFRYADAIRAIIADFIGR